MGTSCTVDECGNPARCRGWCNLHYERWRNYGDALWEPHKPSLAERLESRTRVTPNGCHVWTGTRNASGYGVVSFKHRNLLAHRVVWEQAHGPIPTGKVIDHLCGNPACVRIEHLRVVTPLENAQARVRLERTNTSGYRGVRQLRSGRWSAVVGANGKDHYIGTFDTAEEAAKAARLGRLRLHEAHSLTDLKADAA